MTKILPVIIFLLFAGRAQAQIALSGTWADVSTSLEVVAVTVNPGTDRLFAACFNYERSTINVETLSSVAFGGVAGTLVVEQTNSQHPTVNTTMITSLYIWNEADIVAAVGTDLTFDYSSNTAGSQPATIGYVTLTGVNQAAPQVDSAAAECDACTNLTTAAITTEANGMLIACATMDDDPPAPDPGGFTWNITGFFEAFDREEDGNGIYTATGGHVATTGVPITPDVTFQNTDEMGLIGASFSAAGAAPASVRRLTPIELN